MTVNRMRLIIIERDKFKIIQYPFPSNFFLKRAKWQKRFDFNGLAALYKRLN